MCLRPLCCSSAVATGVARMGGAKALRSSARGVGRDGMCVRASLCVSKSVSESMCVCVCVCVSDSAFQRERVCVCDTCSVCVRDLYVAAVQWLRVSPVWEVPKSCSARRGVWADSVCVRKRVREYVCVTEGVFVIVYVSEAPMLRQCSGYGCRPYGRCQSPTQLGEGCGQIVCQNV